MSRELPNTDAMRELTVDELEQVGGGHCPCDDCPCNPCLATNKPSPRHYAN